MSRMLAIGTAAYGIAGALALLAPTSSSHAAVTVSVGYYDLAPCCGNPNPLPNPWYGSPNTTFFGSVSEATSSDPDESAVLIFNSGPSAVTLGPGASVGGKVLWDSFIGSGYSIASGQYLILSGTSTDAFDGSDEGLGGGKIVSLTFGGVLHNYADTTGVLGGFAAFDETEPWTKIGQVGGSTVPEPGTWILAISGLGLMGGALRRRRATVGLAA